MIQTVKPWPDAPDVRSRDLLLDQEVGQDRRLTAVNGCWLGAGAPRLGAVVETDRGDWLRVVGRLATRVGTIQFLLRDEEGRIWRSERPGALCLVEGVAEEVLSHEIVEWGND